MYTPLLANIAILVLSGFVGFAVISKVPNTLHTPLMSGTNAIHGIVVLGKAQQHCERVDPGAVAVGPQELEGVLADLDIFDSDDVFRNG